MAKKLIELVIEEVSCVDRGANGHSPIMLAKRRQPTGKQFAKAEGVTYNDKVSWSVTCEAIAQALRAKFGGTNQQSEDYWIYIRDVFDSTVVFCQAGEYYRADYTATESNGEVTVELQDKVAVRLTYQDAPEGADQMEKSTQTAADIESIEKRAKAAEDELAAVRKRAEENEARVIELQKKADEDRAVVEKLREEALVEKSRVALMQYTDVAKRKLPALPGDDGEKGKMVKSLYDKLTQPEADEVMKALEAGNAAMQMQMQAVGVTGGGDSASAEGKLRSLAKARAEKDGITLNKAQSLVNKENPDLYAQYNAERRTH